MTDIYQDNSGYWHFHANGHTSNQLFSYQEADSGKCRVLRGGSWSNFARSCRSAFRSRYRPDDGDSYIGFRLVKEVE
jgi:formylglycine-generating enzyme required for sulfatase activity